MGHGRPQSEHHEHQPGELWGMGGRNVGHGRPQSEHHELQPGEMWGMGAHKASIMSISREKCGACAPLKRAS